MIIKVQAHQGRSEPNPRSSVMLPSSRVKVYAAEQRMMVGAEDASAPVLGMFVQTMD
jgi:hypothetical protein